MINFSEKGLDKKLKDFLAILEIKKEVYNNIARQLTRIHSKIKSKHAYTSALAFMHSIAKSTTENLLMKEEIKDHMF
jgi:hypothetical protein